MMESIVYRTRHTSVSAVNYGFLYGYGHCKRSSRPSPDALVNNPRDHQWVRYRARGRRARSSALPEGWASSAPCRLGDGGAHRANAIVRRCARRERRVFRFVRVWG